MTGFNDWVIVLDLDDTLYLEREFVRSGFDAVAADVLHRFGITDFAVRAAGIFEWGDRAHVFDVLAQDYRLDPAIVPSLVAVYRDHTPDIALAPDAARWLQRNRHSRRLALITDGAANTQANKLRALGLDDGGIAPLICTDAWGREWWKPHPRAFEHVADHYQVPGRDCVYVADNPAKDFVAPRALGWRTIQIARPGAIHAGNPAASGGVDADALIHSFDALENVLRRDSVAGADVGRR